MEHLDHAFIPEKIVKRVKRQTIGKRIDQNRAVFILGRDS